jgi:hypothetical protein
VNIATAWVLSYPTVGGGAAMGDLGKLTTILEEENLLCNSLQRSTSFV